MDTSHVADISERADLGAAPGGDEPAVVHDGPAPVGSTGSIDLRQRPSGLAGHVLGAAGQALPGAAVTLVDARGSETGRALVDERGEFLLPGVLAGAYTLVASAPGYRPSASSVTLVGTAATLDLVLKGSGSVEGRALGGRDAVPLVGATVTLVEGTTQHPMAQTGTDEAGRFQFPSVVEGAYRVEVTADGFERGSRPIAVHQGEVAGIDVTLRGTGSVTGFIGAPGGGHVPGVRVLLTSSDGGVLATTVADASGWYRFDAVPEGDYAVVASAFQPAASTADVSHGQATTCDLTLRALGD
jgi:hypothetical protein